MWLAPATEGSASVRSPTREFVTAFARRINAGLLLGRPHWRSRYVVTRQEANRLGFRAVDFWTAINVGLNDAELEVSPEGRVRYQIRYLRWAAAVLVWSATLGLLLVGTLLTIDIRDYIARHSTSRIPGLSMDQNVAVAWGMALFWGFIFPWILIPAHKRPVRRLMERLIAEVDAHSSASSA